MVGLQLPALCPGKACQCGGHTYGFITPEADAACAGAAELGRGCGHLTHVSGYPWANGDGFLP